jgi:hypothetical protein
MRLERPRRRRPEVTFCTNLPGLAETYPLIPAHKAIPEWWRQMGQETQDVGRPFGVLPSTIRRCPAVLDRLTTGWIVPLWTDKVRDFATSPSVPPISVHLPDQREGMPRYPNEDAMAFKLDCMWYVQTPPGYSLRVDPVPYEVDAPVVAMAGLIHTDIYHQFNPVFRYRLQGDGRHCITAGTPLCHVSLLCRADQKIKVTCARDDQRAADLAWRGRGGVGSGGGRLNLHTYRDYTRQRLDEVIPSHSLLRRRIRSR